MNIYLSNLSEDVKEKELRTLFGHLGTVLSVRLIRDRQTKQFKGYAIIEMARAEDAERAIEALEGKKLKGQVMRLDKSPRL